MKTGANRPARIGQRLRLGVAAAVFVAVGLPAWGQNVIDGDTLELGGTTYRLYGVEAADLNQTCADGWSAGRAARAYLRDLVGSREITCSPLMGEREGETEAICRADGVDLGAAMVTGGYALAFVPYSARYISQEEAAVAARRGVHAHDCLTPWAWRQQREDDGD